MREKTKAEILYTKLSAKVKEMNSDEKFMSVRQIMQTYSVSQFTVYQALNKLEATGKIYKDPGKGIYIRGSNSTGKINIGLVVPDWSSPMFTELEMLLKSWAKEYGVTITKYSYPVNSDISSTLPVSKFDVLALVPCSIDLSPEMLFRFHSSPIPVIIIGVPLPGVRVNWVSADHFKTGSMAASYLLKHGHNRLAVLVSEPHSPVIKSRIKGFKEFVEMAGGSVTVIDCDVKSGEYSSDKTYKVFTKYIDNNEINFTGLFVLSDKTSLAAMKALNDHGLAIPDDISVIGSDGLKDGNYYHPPLTAIGTNFNELAKKIIQCAIKTAGTPNYVEGILDEPYLLERNSVKHLSNARKEVQSI